MWCGGAIVAQIDLSPIIWDKGSLEVEKDWAWLAIDVGHARSRIWLLLIAGTGVLLWGGGSGISRFYLVFVSSLSKSLLREAQLDNYSTFRSRDFTKFLQSWIVLDHSLHPWVYLLSLICSILTQSESEYTIWIQFVQLSGAISRRHLSYIFYWEAHGVFLDYRSLLMQHYKKERRSKITSYRLMYCLFHYLFEPNAMDRRGASVCFNKNANNVWYDLVWNEDFYHLLRF